MNSHAGRIENGKSRKHGYICVGEPCPVTNRGFIYGKFINVAVGGNDEAVGHGLESHTRNVRAVKCRNPRDPSRNYVFIYTPGFNDTYLSDTNILIASRHILDHFLVDLGLGGGISAVPLAFGSQPLLHLAFFDDTDELWSDIEGRQL